MLQVNYVIRRVIEELKKDKRILFAYMFGSHISGKTMKESDIDIGIYVDPRTTKKERFDIRLHVSGLSAIDRELDVVVMNDASLLLNYNVIKGRLLFSRDETKRVSFESVVMTRYMDMKPYSIRHIDQRLKVIAKRGLS